MRSPWAIPNDPRIAESVANETGILPVRTEYAEQEQPRKRKKRKLPKIISAAEAAALLSAAEQDAKVTNTEALRNRLILEFMYRAVRIWRITEGPSEIHRWQIARRILGQ